MNGNPKRFQSISPTFRRARRRQGGFTLIEMVVAAIVLVVGIVAALGAIGAATRSSETAGGYSTAAILAYQHFADMESQPDQIIPGDQNGDFGPDFPKYKWTSTTESTDFPALVRVTVTITWSAGPKEKQAQFISYEPSSTGASQSPTTVPTTSTK